MGGKSTEQDIYDCLHQFLGPLIQKYENGEYIKYESNMNEIKKSNKVPVWVFWWQGLEDAPEIVKWCINSMERTINKETATIHFVTQKNIWEYIDFPEFIIQKFEDKKITITHFSDIVRAYLLYDYGGIWLDATYFIADERINEIISKPGFYTQKFGENAGRNDLVNGRWSCSFMKTEKKFPLFGFLIEAFETYWKEMDTLISYFFIDYLIALAYDHVKIIQEKMKLCPVNNPDTFQLMEICNTTYKQSHYDDLLKNTFLFKMTYKMETKKTNILGEPSFYGYLLQMSK